MPIYEYQCQSCGHGLEKLQRMNDESLKECPECGKAELQRLVSAAAFRLKGAGWYETDFKKGDKKNLHDSGGSTSTSSKKSAPDSAKPADTKKADTKKVDSTAKTSKSNAD